jgi:hypothetical protein
LEDFILYFNRDAGAVVIDGYPDLPRPSPKEREWLVVTVTVGAKPGSPFLLRSLTA